MKSYLQCLFGTIRQMHKQSRFINVQWTKINDVKLNQIGQIYLVPYARCINASMDKMEK